MTNSEARLRLKMRSVQLASQTSAFLIASQYLREYIQLTEDFEAALVVSELENQELQKKLSGISGGGKP